jgi:hypothetical protein
MKKLVLTSTALLALAAASYAQLITQVGRQQFARQNQFGQNQTGVISQVQTVGDPNRVNYGNYAVTFQGTPANTGANNLVLNQNAGSQGNRAGISQSGGPNNNATINQNGGPDGLSGGATSASATIGAAGEDGNFAGIAQIGAANTAIINENNNSRRNTAETYQNGNNNTATTNQSNNSVNNTALVYQGFSGPSITSTAVNNAVALITQGKANAGDISTGSATPEAVGNTAIITQTASNVTAAISQGGPTGIGGVGRADGVEARITQSATGVEAAILQGVDGGEAIGSKAFITQTATNQSASIFQGTGATGSDNQSTASITQNGASGVPASTVSIFQGNSGATDRDQAIVVQTGSVANANAVIFQGNGASAYSSGDKATIAQQGQGVVSVIFQSIGNTNSRDNVASITQGASVVGNGTTTGFGLITQGSSAGSVLEINRNTATLNQIAGTGLTAQIVQGAQSAVIGANGASFGITTLNGVALAQTGTITSDNMANLTQQAGDNHNANIFQTGGRYNTASVAQNRGNGATALIVQTANAQWATASISQTSAGTGNSAYILQYAGSNADRIGTYGNMASISQVAGSNNLAFVQQGIPNAATSSNDNLASITQNGSGNFARFLQVGNNNAVSITQNGDNNRVLNLAGDPGSYGSQQGYNNRLTLVQEGGTTGVTFRYTQIGNNNMQVVNQHY